jgi:hypothetical protein
VLVVVGDEVAQREPVVRGDDVDGRRRPAPAAAEEVPRPGRTGRGLRERAVDAAPEVAHGVAEAPVPLRPQRGEPAEVVAVGLTDVPGLGDELDLGEHRVLVDKIEERRRRGEPAGLPPEGGGEVEAEAVDVHLGRPVPQAVEEHPQGRRVGDVEGVAAAGCVVVAARVAGHQPVVGRVVEALVAQGRAVLVALRGVVVDDVEDDLDARGVQARDHRLELPHLPAAAAGAGGRRVAGVRREEADRVVAPVVRQPLLPEGAVRHVLVHRQELDRGDAEAAQVPDGRGVRETGIGAAKLGRDVGMRRGEALDVHLVQHGVRVGDAGRGVAAPVVGRVDDHRARHRRCRVAEVAPAGRVRPLIEGVAEDALVPGDVPVDRLRVGIEEELGRIAAQPARRVVRPVDAEAVAIAGLHARHEPVPHPGVVLEQVDPPLGVVVREQAELDAIGDLGGDGDVRAAVHGRRPEREGPAGQGCVVRHVLTLPLSQR